MNLSRQVFDTSFNLLILKRKMIFQYVTQAAGRILPNTTNRSRTYDLFGYYSRCSTTQLQETCRGVEATKLPQIHVTDMSCILQGLIVIVVYSSESSFLAKSPFIFLKIRL